MEEQVFKNMNRLILDEQIHTQLKEFIDHLKEMQDKDSVDMSMPIQVRVFQFFKP